MKKELPIFAQILKNRTNNIKINEESSILDSFNESLNDIQQDKTFQTFFELKKQLEIIKIENKDLKHELSVEKAVNDELSNQIYENEKIIKEEKKKNQTLNDEISHLEQILSDKQQITESKNKILEKLQDEYNKISLDYQKILDLYNFQNNQLQQLRNQINELENELNSQFLPENKIEKKNLNFQNNFIYNNNFENNNQIFENNNNFINEIKLSPVKKAALVDNIVFGENITTSNNQIEELFQNLSKEELNILLNEFIEEKSFLEKSYAQAPKRGISKTRNLREKNEIENKIDDLNKKIYKLKRELKKFIN